MGGDWKRVISNFNNLRCKLAEIAPSIYILDINWVECKTSSVISFVYFTDFLNLNIFGTNADICKRYAAFLFTHGIICDTFKKSRVKS